MNNKIHPAYLAGVADSDGSFTISKTHLNRLNVHYQCSFQLTWKKTPKSIAFFEKLKEQYGGSFFHQKAYPNSSFTQSPTIKYWLGNIKLEKFIKDILPYLELKKEQAENILEIRSLSPLGLYNKYNPKPESVKQLQNEIWLKSRNLNTKNSGNRSKNANHFS